MSDEEFKEHVRKKLNDVKLDLRIYLVNTQNQVEKLNEQISFLEDMIKWLEVKHKVKGGYSSWAKQMSKGGKK